MRHDRAVERLAATREALHAVAEQVLATARYHATGRIGLAASPGGFSTPPFAVDGVTRTVGIHGTEVVVTDDGDARRAPLTTLRAAAALAGIEPGAPADVYTPNTSLDPDEQLDVDATAAGTIADWFGLVSESLTELVRSHPGSSATTATLWPEHFDLAVSIDDVAYGGSPGDEEHPQPYLYIGPSTPPAPDGTYWNEPFGASRPAALVPDVVTALVFWGEGRELLAGPSA
jgi:hypothetical protein